MRPTSEWEFNIKFEIIKGNIQDLLDYINEKVAQDSTIIESHEKFDANLKTELLINKMIEIKSMIPYPYIKPYHCDE